MLHRGLRLEGGPREQVGRVLLGDDRLEERRRRETKPPFAQRLRDLGEPAQDAHGLDTTVGGSLAVVEAAGQVVPERPEASLQIGATTVELFEVEEEVDLDCALVASQFGEAEGERSGIEAGRIGWDNKVVCVHGYLR